MNKSRYRHITAILLFILTGATLAGRYLISLLTLGVSLAVYAWNRSVDKRVRARTRHLELQIETLKNQSSSSVGTPQTPDIMDTCARFAGGVAHDLNNILSGLVTFPEMLLMDLPEGSPLEKPLNAIARSGLRASGVVADLVKISRGISGDKIVLNINTAIGRFMSSDALLTMTETFPDLTIVQDLDPNLLNITGSTEHMETIITNLLVHGREAVMGEGRLLIKTENRYLDSPLRSKPDIPAGEYVCLSVSDNGVRLSPEDVEHIFEPYYCKKVMNRSCSGLGLPIVWNMVKEARGYIAVRSGDTGSTFEIYVPACRETVGLEPKHPSPLADVSANGETILVIDDDELQRDIASGILSQAGYDVQTVPSGEDAVTFIRKRPVDLIVLDMIMTPGINGYETYRQIIRITPNQKAIIASGYARSTEVEKVQALGAGSYIRKPYTVNNLLQVVKTELAGVTKTKQR